MQSGGAAEIPDDGVALVVIKPPIDAVSLSALSDSMTTSQMLLKST